MVLARLGDEYFAVGGSCPHYGGPLIKGLLINHELRCPLHHACFDLRTGEALRAPAFDPIPCWRTERIGNTVFVREKLPPSIPRQAPISVTQQSPASVVIVGGGAAGLAAAEMLRREGYDGAVTIISADDAAPYDRPNLSKEFLAGKTPEEWMPLRSSNFYKNQRVDLVLNSLAKSIDVPGKRIHLESGRSIVFGALLLATGADPIHLPISGGAPPSQLQYLRTLADCRSLIGKVASAKKVMIVGASFIALEVAASLRERGVSVHVVAPEQVPFERPFGAEVGHFVRDLHESHGVVFHLGKTVSRFDGRQATLSSGTKLDADLLIIGAGVRPSVALAEQAGLKLDRGILVNEYLETSVPGIFAAGDIARWPDPYSGQSIRIEHWVVAERQGQTAARNILGKRERFAAVPYFWTRQYGVSMKHIGYAEKWDAIEIDGSLEAKSCTLTYKFKGRVLAVTTVGRDLDNLAAEAAIEGGLK